MSTVSAGHEPKEPAIRRAQRRVGTAHPGIWVVLLLLAAAGTLGALWTVPTSVPAVRIVWDDAVDDARRVVFERRLGLVAGTRGDDGVWNYLLVDRSRANLATIVETPVIADSALIDRQRLVATGPEVVRPVGPVALQSLIVVGLGLVLLAGAAAPTVRLRVVCAAGVCGLLLVSASAAPLPTRATFDNGEWMGDYFTYVEDRDNFERYFAHTSILFPHHLTAVVLNRIDRLLGATAESPPEAFRWLSRLAGLLFVIELIAIATLVGWSATAVRYLALCVAAPVSLFFFGYRELGYLSLSAAGVPLLLRGLAREGGQRLVVAAGTVLGLRAALHGFGLLSLAGGALASLAAVGTWPTRVRTLFTLAVCSTTAYVGWVVWYLVGLTLPVLPGHAENLYFRPLTTPYVAESRIVPPILSAAGLIDIGTTALIVGVPILLLGLWSTDSARDRRRALLFSLPALAFFLTWWPVQGVRMELDVICATFPALFAGLWLCATRPAATALGMVLLAVAHLAFWFVALSPDSYGSTLALWALPW